MIQKFLNKKFLKQFSLYFATALLGYLVDFGTLVLLTELFNVHYLVAASSGFILGLICTYILSTRFVFGNSKLNSKKAEFSLFAIIGIVGLALLNILMWLFTDIIGFNYIVSKVVATVFVYMWNFFARRALYYNEE